MTIETAVLGKKLVDALPTRNPDEAVSPWLFSPLELSLSQQRSNGLRRRSKRIRCFSDSEVVHLGKTVAQPSSPSETF